MSQTSRRTLARFAVGAGFSLASSACCGGSAYVKAAGTFATAETTSAQSLSGVGATLRSNCLSRANVTFVQIHLGLLPQVAGDPTDWPNWYKKAHTAQLTWSDYCDEVVKTGDLFKKGVDALNPYGKALSTLSADATYDGTNITTIGNDASTIATSLKDTNLGTTPIRSAGCHVPNGS